MTRPQVSRVGVDALRVAEAAEQLAVPMPFVRLLVGHQMLVGVKIPHGQWRVSRESVALLRRAVGRIRQLSK